MADSTALPGDLVTAAVGHRSLAARAWLPVALAVSTVLLQILYPLVAGDVRDSLTIITVVVFGTASLTHAWIVRGGRAALLLALVFAGGGLLVEIVGVATGMPFGTYLYSGRLGWQTAGVPLVIPVAWLMMGYPALVVARRITTRPLPGIVVAGFALASWDLFLDPQMVAEGYWSWSGEGMRLIDSVPVSNFLGWLVIATVMMALLWPLADRWTVQEDDRVPVALYGWTWIGSLTAHLAFFRMPVSGLYGGIAMGVVAILFIRSVRRQALAGVTADHSDRRATRMAG